MHSKTKRIFAVIMFVCVVFALIFSAIFVISHINHECTDEHCPVCAQIHNIENLLKKLFSALGFFAVGILLSCGLLRIRNAFSRLKNTDINTLIGKKIRLNI